MPAALSAFLRGVERRGALFAELQCGDRDAGDTALAAALRAFRNHAGELAMAEWPQRFWSLLVSAPPLRQASDLASWPPGLRALAPLGSAARRALLLRLVAGLPEEDAARVLGVETATYQQALADACPREADGQPDALAWRSLAEAIQQQLRDLPPERLARLARLREEAIAGTRHERPRTADAPAASKPKSSAVAARRRWPWVALVLGVCALALAATWWWPRWQGSPAADAVLEQGVQRLQNNGEISSEVLPAQAPEARFDATTGLLTHPDFELVMDAQEEALARDADFYAWYVAATSAAAEESPPAEAQTADKTDATETSDAQL
ncbi:MAG: hypothetical protein ABI538_07945 [Pseudoxanthomonas sp.]